MLSCPVVYDSDQIGEIDKNEAPDVRGFERVGGGGEISAKKPPRRPVVVPPIGKSAPLPNEPRIPRRRHPMASMRTRSMILWPSTVGWMPSGEIRSL